MLDPVGRVAELWKDIPGIPYQVSDLGKIRGTTRIVTNNRKRYIKYAAYCEQHLDKNGYYFVRLSFLGKIKNYRVHQLVALAFHGPCPIGKTVDHKDRVRTNNVPDNLRYATDEEQKANRVLNPAKGSKCNLSKLTEEQVVDIRQSTLSNLELSKIHNVSKTTINRIRKRSTWNHV